MKISTRLLAATGICLTLCSVAIPAGDLNPTAPPGPTMRTLSAIEPRTPVATLPGSATAVHTISQSGSYYMTRNLAGETAKNGIEITANNVTLDLNGFQLVGVSGSLDGICVQHAIENVAVSNGTVRGWGNDGIRLQDQCRAENIHAADNTGSGVHVGSACLISNCQATQNTTSGFDTKGMTVVRNCVSSYNGSEGIIIRDNCGQVLNCVFSDNGYDGIGAGNGGGWLIQGNTCDYNDNHGISVCGSSIILDNVCTNNGDGASVTDGAGINLRCGDNLVRGNLLYGNDVGVAAAPSGNEVVIQNVANNHSGGSYTGFSGNDFGPTGTAATATSPWANIHH